MAVMPGLRAAVARKLRRLGAAARTLRTADVRLMLAGTGAPFDREGWIFELKYDGFRLLAGNEDGRARLRYRRGSDATAAFPEVAAALAPLDPQTHYALSRKKEAQPIVGVNARLQAASKARAEHLPFGDHRLDDLLR